MEKPKVIKLRGTQEIGAVKRKQRKLNMSIKLQSRCESSSGLFAIKNWLRKLKSVSLFGQNSSFTTNGAND